MPNKLFDDVPLIEGERLVLCALDEGDAVGLQELIDNTAVYLHEPAFLFERQFGDAREAIRQVYGEPFGKKRSLILAIRLRETGDFCDLAEFYGPRDDAHKISIGYWILERFWSRGFATETVACMVGYLLRRTDILVITASTLPENGASARVLQKNGFVCTAHSVDEDWGFELPLPTDKWVWQENAGA